MASVPFFACLLGLFVCVCGVAFGLASPFVFASALFFLFGAAACLFARVGF